MAVHDDVGIGIGEAGQRGASRMDVFAARLPGGRVHQQQPLAAEAQLLPMRARRKPLRQIRVDAVASPRPGALRPEKVFLMIADNDPCVTIAQQPDHLVRETVLVNAVAKTDQLVDIAHQGKRFSQPRGVAVNIGDDPDFHAFDPVNSQQSFSLAPNAAPRCET
jgi:hypothetical protein